MAAAIVYEGVVGGGDMFQGMKLYILQRVPDRNRWKGLVESNGGEIVQVESQADMVIADRARKFCPAGSISWHWIEQSVKKGELQDIEDYRAGPATSIIREVGSAQPARKGRTPFTAEDDLILREWCTKAERKGVPMRGNELYKQIETKYPQHTFQSWRDRWIKHVSLQSRPQLPDHNEDEEEDDVPTNRSIVTQRIVSRAAVSQLRPVASPSTAPVATTPAIRVAKASKAAEKKTVPRSSPGPPSSPFVAKTAESAGGNIFTEEETEALLEVYDDILNLREDAIIDAWMTWASAHPNHTAQEWRNYFTEYLVPRQRAQKESKNVVAQPSELSPPANIKPKGSPRRHESPNNREIRDSQDSTDQVLESQKRAKRAADPTTTNEKLFKHYLSILAESFEIVVDFEPKICGRVMPLFKVWQVVQSEEFGGFDEVDGRNLWPQVARKLNYNDWRHSSAAEDLKVCFSEILADFEEVREQEREENSLTESQEEALIDSQLRQTAARETQPTSADEEDEDDELVEEEEELEDDLDAPQSSPQIIPSSSSKRSFGTDRTNQPISFNKRQRIDKGKGKELEIPSTPEGLINNNQEIRPSHQLSPLYHSSPHEPDLYGESSEDEFFVRQINFRKPEAKPSPQPRILEPETQDFHFPPELDNEDKNSLTEISSSPPPQNQHQQHSSNSTSNAATHGTAHSSNQYDSSTQSQTESQKAAEINEYIEHHVGMGIPQDVVISALEATTMDPGISSPVMESLMNGDGIPEDIAGVWTSWDDDALEAGVESEDYTALIRKHGVVRLGLRKRYLKDLREVNAEIAQRLTEEGGQSEE